MKRDKSHWFSKRHTNNKSIDEIQADTEVKSFGTVPIDFDRPEDIIDMSGIRPVGPRFSE
jgi:hypothetical protein